MGKDIDFKLVVEGETRDAAAAVDKTVKDLSRLKEAVKRMSSERQKIAQMERRDRYNTLSDEQKLTRLRERQLQLERQLARARSSGNEYRQSALATSLAKARFEIGRLSAQQKQAKGNQASGMGPGDVLGGASIVGMLPGGKAITAIAAGMAGVAYAVKRGFEGALAFADEISDMADLIGSSRSEVSRLMKAAGAAGVRSQSVMSSISALAAARGGALSGDEEMLAMFRRYGVSKETLQGNASNLNIAQSIVRSLGSDGMLPTDRLPLGKLFGRRPEQMVATLMGMDRSGEGNNPSLEKDLRKMDEVNTKLEVAVLQLKEAAVHVAAIAASAAEFAYPFLKRAFLRTKTGVILSAGMALAGKMAPSDNATNNPTGSPSNLPNGRTADPKPYVPGPSTNVPSMAIPNGDSLARIGLYRGGIDPARADILRSQLETLRGIRQEQIRTVAAILGAWS